MCGIAGLLGIDPALARAGGASACSQALRHRGPDDEGRRRRRARRGRRPGGLRAHPALDRRPVAGGASADGGSPGGSGARAERRHVQRGNLQLPRALARARASRAGRAERARTPRRCSTRTGSGASARSSGSKACSRSLSPIPERARSGSVGIGWASSRSTCIGPPQAGSLFASEVRALLAAGGRARDASPASLRRRELPCPGRRARATRPIVEGVTLLPPGESLVCDFEGRLLRSTRYWSVAFGHGAGADTRPADGSVPEPGSHARRRARALANRGRRRARRGARRVRRQAPARGRAGRFVPVVGDRLDRDRRDGRRGSPRTALRTLAVGFDVPELDESLDAAETARELGSPTSASCSPADEVARVRSTTSSARWISRPSTASTRSTSRARRAERASPWRSSGLGGDELFGGYASFSDVPRALRLARARLRCPVARGASSSLRQALAALASRIRSLRAPTRARSSKASEALGRAVRSRRAVLLAPRAVRFRPSVGRFIRLPLWLGPAFRDRARRARCPACVARRPRPARSHRVSGIHELHAAHAAPRHGRVRHGESARDPRAAARALRRRCRQRARGAPGAGAIRDRSRCSSMRRVRCRSAFGGGRSEASRFPGACLAARPARGTSSTSRSSSGPWEVGGYRSECSRGGSQRAFAAGDRA